MAETFHVGRLSKLYYNTGTYDIPVWTEMVRLGDMTTPITKNTSQVVTRESPNQKTVVGAKAISVTGTYYEKVQADTVLAALKASIFANSAGATGGTIEVASMNQDIATDGSTGIRGFVACTDLTRNEPVGDAVTRSVTLEEVDHEEDSSVVDFDEYTISA